jgi:hypothetical protein
MGRVPEPRGQKPAAIAQRSCGIPDALRHDAVRSADVIPCARVLLRSKGTHPRELNLDER